MRCALAILLFPVLPGSQVTARRLHVVPLETLVSVSLLKLVQFEAKRFFKLLCLPGRDQHSGQRRAVRCWSTTSSWYEAGNGRYDMTLLRGVHAARPYTISGGLPKPRDRRKGLQRVSDVGGCPLPALEIWFAHGLWQNCRFRLLPEVVYVLAAKSGRYLVVCRSGRPVSLMFLSEI
jgi:hypothetical protein